MGLLRDRRTGGSRYCQRVRRYYYEKSRSGPNEGQSAEAARKVVFLQRRCRGGWEKRSGRCCAHSRPGQKQACLTSLSVQTHQARTKKPFQRLLSAPKRYPRTHRTSEGTAERVGGEKNGRHHVHSWPGPNTKSGFQLFAFTPKR